MCQCKQHQDQVAMQHNKPPEKQSLVASCHGYQRFMRWRYSAASGGFGLVAPSDWALICIARPLLSARGFHYCTVLWVYCLFEKRVGYVWLKEVTVWTVILTWNNNNITSWTHWLQAPFTMAAHLNQLQIRLITCNKMFIIERVGYLLILSIKEQPCLLQAASQLSTGWLSFHRQS